MSVPWWRLPRSLDRSRADLVVVGGGIAGACALRAAAERGMEAVLLERGFLACGASGRNAGYLMRGAADNYAAACASMGREAARVLWRLSERNLERLRGWGAERSAGFERRASCLVATSDREADELDSSFAMLREDGFAVDRLDPAAVDDALCRTLPRDAVGLINPGDAVCDPTALIGTVSAPVRGQVVEGATVEAIEPSGDGVAVRCAGLEVRGSACILCVNGLGVGLSPMVSRLVSAHRGQMLALDASPMQRWKRALALAYYLDRGADYIRQADARTILVGGRRAAGGVAERTDDDEPTATVQRELEAFAEERLGVRLPVAHRWAGVMGFTRTGLPAVGPVDSAVAGVDAFEGRLWAAVGFTGHGMSLAAEVSALAVAAIAGERPRELEQLRVGGGVV